MGLRIAFPPAALGAVLRATAALRDTAGLPPRPRSADGPGSACSNWPPPPDRGRGGRACATALAPLDATVVVVAATPALKAEARRVGTDAGARPDALDQGPVRSRAPARARSIRGRHLMDRSRARSRPADRPRSPTACTAASACRPARPTRSGAKRWIPRAGASISRSASSTATRSRPTTVGHFDACLGCMACMTRLPVRRRLQHDHRDDPGRDRGDVRAQPARPGAAHAGVLAVPVPAPAAPARRRCCGWPSGCTSTGWPTAGWPAGSRRGCRDGRARPAPLAELLARIASHTAVSAPKAGRATGW